MSDPPGLTVAFRGNFLPDVDPGACWSTECHLAKTLEAMGHRVLRLQENAVGWDVVVDVASRSDLLLWVTTWNRDPEGGFRALAELRRRGVPTVSFHLDLYFGIARSAKVLEEPFFRCDHVFTADGGHEAEFAAAGVNHHWSPPAVYEAEAVSGSPRPEYVTDVGFVGSYPYPHPEHAGARADLVRFCQQQWRGRFRVWRSGVRGEALSDLYASVKVVVGDSCLAGKIGSYWSDRVPETLGRGGFLVHPYVPGMEEQYTDGRHLRFFEAGDLFALRSLVDYYLEHDEERRRIAAEGQRHVRAHHTYAHRMQAVLEVARATAGAR